MKKLYIGKALESLARRFTASQGWLFRFTKRWRISYKCKTNVKRVPIELRLGKIKRYFALLRRRLKEDAKHPQYNAQWGLFPLRNRWSLDQVPAGFFAPKRTYHHVGDGRVHVAANECADNHRECTLQVRRSLLALPHTA